MSLLGYFNRFLPFATPGTPLLQDVVHLGVICALLYYAPQIQEWLKQRDRQTHHEGEVQADGEGAQNAEIPRREEGVEEDVGDPEQQPVDGEIEHADDDGANDEGFQEFQRQQARADAVEAGPANGANMPSQRNVGAKKAKSLARRDQRRAYHEFQRAQGEAQRARDAEGAAEREAARATEQERRREVEAKLEAKKAKERELKREQERKTRGEEIQRRELAVSLVRQELESRKMSNVFDVARQVGGDTDDVWVEKILKASGVLGRAPDGTLTMVTGTGWVVRVRKEDMAEVYELAARKGLGDEQGKIEFDEIGRLLEDVLSGRRPL